MTQDRAATTTRPAAELVPLGESDQTIDHEQDIRGSKAFDTAGQQIGTVDELLIDPVQGQVRFLRLKGGGILGIGDSHWLLPVEAVAEVTDGAVHINQSQQRLAGAPRYQPDLVGKEHFEAVYGYWGYAPYWGPGYLYPAMWWGGRM